MNKSRKAQSKETLTIYLKEISSIPLLTHSEELDLGRRIQKGDGTAMQKLVESNLRFVIKYAKRYTHCGISFTDLINEGNIGMMTAAKRFDPDRNVRFISYAVWWIRQSMMSAIANMSRPFRLPAKINNALNRVRFFTNAHGDESQEQPTLAAMATSAGMKEEQLSFLMSYAGTGVSLNQPRFEDEDMHLDDVLIQSRIPSGEELAVEKSVKRSLKNVLQGLQSREQEILRLRFGLDNDKTLTLRQIGIKMGVSRERVRQIQEAALQKIRKCGKALPFQAEVNLLARIVDSKEPTIG